jgi:hypothetical protein
LAEAVDSIISISKPIADRFGGLAVCLGDEDEVIYLDLPVEGLEGQGL